MFLAKKEYEKVVETLTPITPPDGSGALAGPTLAIPNGNNSARHGRKCKAVRPLVNGFIFAVDSHALFIDAMENGGGDTRELKIATACRRAGGDSVSTFMPCGSGRSCADPSWRRSMNAQKIN